MKCLFLEIEETELEFFLLDSEVDESMKKKLAKLGFPDIWLKFSENPQDKFTEISKGVFQQGMFPGSSVCLTEPATGGAFSIRYMEDTNSIVLKLKGMFFSVNNPDLEGNGDGSASIEDQTFGFAQIITVNNEKNKPVKKPKDEYGMATRLEALAVNTAYDGSGYKVNFRVVIKDGRYKDGEVVNE